MTDGNADGLDMASAAYMETVEPAGQVVRPRVLVEHLRETPVSAPASSQ
jgi:hypothetical protein